jgi:hypothetical protein
MRKDLGAVAVKMVDEVDTGFRTSQEPTQCSDALEVTDSNAVTTVALTHWGRGSRYRCSSDVGSRGRR